MKTRIFFVLLISLLLSLTQSVKADTIHITLTVPFQTQNFCQDSMNFDTFIIHKNQYFTGIPTWYISNLPVAVCDSFVYVPTSSVSVLITAIWNYNEYGVRLNLYSTPPSHANFEIFSGGSINTAGDTAYMCGMGGLSLGANALGDESFTWYGPGGFTSTSNPIAVTTPGIYVFERLNPCGTTRDSVEVIYLPVTIPVWSDTTFCNVPVNLTLDPGPGWNYLWNTGATTQTLTVSDSGFYKVRLSNQCVVLDSAWIHVSQVNFPLPEFDTVDIQCHEASVLLNPNTSYTYDSYLWNTGATTSEITVTEPSAMYTVTITEGGCTAEASVDVIFQGPTWRPSLCIATVDTFSLHNQVRFESQNDSLYDGAPIVAYSIYKYETVTGTMTLLATIPDTVPSGTLIEYEDITSNPQVQATAYVVTAIDTCGNESVRSFYHRTIKIDTDIDAQQGKIDLTIIDEYIDESETYVPTMYYILIDSLNNGTFAILDSLTGGNHQYSVLNPVQGATYLMGVALPWACDPSKVGTKSLNQTMSLSNKSSQYMGINSYDGLSHVRIYPNPSTGIFQIEGESVSRVEVRDVFGRLLQVVEHPTSILDCLLLILACIMYESTISRGQQIDK